jgi:hypothetical protein
MRVRTIAWAGLLASLAHGGDHERSLGSHHRLADSFVKPRLFSATEVLGRDLAHVVMFGVL